MTRVAGMQYALGFNASPFVQHSRQAASSAGRLRTALLGGAEGASRLNIQLFAAGFIGATALQNAVRIASDFEMTILRASQATLEQSKHTRRLARESKALSEQFATGIDMTSRLQLSISRMGVNTVVPATADVTKLTGRLNEASTALALMADIAEEDAARSLFRLALTTGRTKEETEALINNSLGMASALVTLGDSISAGIPEYLKLIQEFQQLGIVTNLSTAEVLALGAAFAQIDPGKAGRITSGMTRMFAQEFVGNASALARFMELSNDEFERMRVERPFEFFMRFVGSIVEARDAGEDVARTVRDMGFGNIRDLRNTFLAVGMYEQIPGLLAAAEEQLHSQSEAVSRVNDLLATFQKRWDAMRFAFQRAGETVGRVVIPPLTMLLSVLEGLANIVADNKFIAGMVALGGIGVAGATIGRAGVFGAGALGRIGGFGGGPFGTLFAASGRNMRGVTGTGGARSGMLGGGPVGADAALLAGATLAPRGFVGGFGQQFTHGIMPDPTLSASDSLIRSREIDRMRRRNLALATTAFASAQLGAFREVTNPLTGQRALRGPGGQFFAYRERLRGHGAMRVGRPGIRGPVPMSLLGLGALAHDPTFQRGRQFSQGRFGRFALAPGSARAAAAGRAGLSAGDVLLSAALLGPRAIGRGIRGAGRGIGRLFGGRQTAQAAFFAAMDRGGHTVTARQGPIARLGRGRLGAPIGRFLQGMMGGGNAARIGTGAARLAGGGLVGAGIGVVSLLGPVFREVGNFFARIGEQEGAIGAVANTLAIVFRTLQLISNLLKVTFNFLFDIIGRIFKFIGNLPGVKQLFGLIGGGLRGGAEGLERANVALGDRRSRFRGNDAGITVNVFNDGDASAEATGMIARTVSGRGSGVL